jgi:NUMOD3 motif
MFVYVIVNSETLKIYIGQHKGTNLQKYLQQKLSHARHGQYAGRSHLYAAMRQHPKSVWSIHPLISVPTLAEVGYHERKLIAALSARNPDVGYNLCEGGAGCSAALGCKHSLESSRNAHLHYANREQWKLNLSEAHKKYSPQKKGARFTAEHCANLSRAHKGQRAWNKGTPCSEDARRKNSEAHKGQIPWNKGKRSSKNVYSL